MTGRKREEHIATQKKTEQTSCLWLHEAWNVTGVNFLKHRFHIFFEDFVQKRSSHHCYVTGAKQLVSNFCKWSYASVKFGLTLPFSRGNGKSKNLEATHSVSFLFPICVARSKRLCSQGFLVCKQMWMNWNHSACSYHHVQCTCKYLCWALLWDKLMTRLQHILISYKPNLHVHCK